MSSADNAAEAGPGPIEDAGRNRCIYREITGVETSPPPFVFEDVASRVFPLRADLNRLQRLCDRMLNVMPAEYSHCRPLGPWVLLCVLTYGRMEAGADQQASGWVPQNELLFSVPVLWRHRDDNGEMVEEIASVSPFIFVDEPMSVATGREVYGWPKILARFEPEIQTWTEDVVTRPRRIRLHTEVFPRAFAGLRPEMRPLLEIDLDPTDHPATWPPSMNVPLNPLVTLRRTFEEGLRFSQDLFATLRTVVEDGAPMIPFSNLGDSVTDPGQFSFPTLNLKQFPQSRGQRTACYQALVSSPMEILGVRGGGLLGDLPLLRGDACGGFKVRIWDRPEFPITQLLGLQVDRTERGDEPGLLYRGVTRGAIDEVKLTRFESTYQESMAETCPVSVVRPLWPYWMDVDLYYGRGREECWRTHDRDWSTTRQPGAPSDEPLYFNTTAGGVVKPLQGPFFFPRATIRALVLTADLQALQAFVDDHLNAVGSRYRFEVRSPVVLMLTFSYGATEAEGQDVGWWADRNVGFWVPLIGHHPDGEACEFLTAPFLFDNSHLASMTLRETFGLPILAASIESAPHPFLEQDGPVVDEPLMRLAAGVYRGFYANQRSETNYLLELIQTGDLGVAPGVFDGEGAVDELTRHELVARMRKAEEEARRVAQEAARAAVPANLREGGGRGTLLENPLPHWSRSVFLKQFRNASCPEEACYQSLVLGSMEIHHLRTVSLEADALELRIHRYPSHPIVSTLGLAVENTEYRASPEAGRVWEGRPVDVLRPKAAFWMTVDLKTGYAEEELALHPPPAKEPAAEDCP